MAISDNQLESLNSRGTGGKEEKEKGMQAREDGFQAGQTAKARRGPPCAVTPFRDTAPASDTDSIRKYARLNHRRKRVSSPASDPNDVGSKYGKLNRSNIQFSRPAHPTSIHDDSGTASGVVAGTGGSGRVHCLDGYS